MWKNRVVVLSRPKLADPLPCHAQEEGWAKSLSLCHHEAHARDDNKISGQCICVITWRCSTTNCAATLTIGCCLADQLHLRCSVAFLMFDIISPLFYFVYFCANQPSADKTQREFMIPLIVVAWFYLLLVLFPKSKHIQHTRMHTTHTYA
jgi:hypothetical protein